jgi:hypothetical protein
LTVNFKPKGDEPPQDYVFFGQENEKDSLKHETSFQNNIFTEYMISMDTPLVGIWLSTTFCVIFFKIPPCHPRPKLHRFSSIVTHTPNKGIGKVGPGVFGNILCCIF